MGAVSSLAAVYKSWWRTNKDRTYQVWCSLQDEACGGDGVADCGWMRIADECLAAVRQARSPLIITAGDMPVPCHATPSHRIHGHACLITAGMREPLSAVQIANFLFY